MAVKVIGLDTAKHVFQIHGADGTGRAVLKKRLRRGQVADFFGSIPRCLDRYAKRNGDFVPVTHAAILRPTAVRS